MLGSVETQCPHKSQAAVSFRELTKSSQRRTEKAEGRLMLVEQPVFLVTSWIWEGGSTSSRVMLRVPHKAPRNPWHTIISMYYHAGRLTDQLGPLCIRLWESGVSSSVFSVIHLGLVRSSGHVYGSGRISIGVSRHS